MNFFLCVCREITTGIELNEEADSFNILRYEKGPPFYCKYAYEKRMEKGNSKIAVKRGLFEKSDPKPTL